MELRRLRYFVAVAEAGSLTLAAEKKHTAQPSLSRQIRDLEYDAKWHKADVPVALSDVCFDLRAAK
jgi:Bacterial regulatory helix-turn-helix protein, lysR family